MPAWLAKNPGVTMHFTPTSGSWRHMVETYIDAWNERCQPFTWTKTADEILTKAPAVKDHR